MMMKNVSLISNQNKKYNAFNRRNDPQQRLAIISKNGESIAYQYMMIDPISYVHLSEHEEVSFEIRDNLFTLIGHNLRELFKQLQRQKIEHLTEFCEHSYDRPESDASIIKTITRQKIIKD